MRILMVSLDNVPYARSRSHEILVAEEMARHGHDVHLVVERQPRYRSDEGKPEGLTVQVEPLNDPGVAPEAIAGRLPMDMDVAFASSQSGAPVLAKWKELSGKRVVTQVLDTPMWRLAWRENGPWLAEWRPRFDGLTRMDHVIFNTRVNQGELQDLANLYEYKGHLPSSSVVYYGIDTDACDRVMAGRIDPRPLHVAVSVSRLVAYKGYDFAIGGLATLPVDERPSYMVIGVGEEVFRLQQLAQLSGVDVALMGGLDDAGKFEAIKASDYGLYVPHNPHIPSQFPAECVYAGKPCILSDLPINRERYGGMPGVEWVHPFDTRGIGEAVRRVQERLQTRDAFDVDLARSWIEANRSFRSHARGVLGILEGLVAR